MAIKTNTYLGDKEVNTMPTPMLVDLPHPMVHTPDSGDMDTLRHPPQAAYGLHVFPNIPFSTCRKPRAPHNTNAYCF